MTDSFVTSKKFFDNKNFPRGFSRQGDFTIKEATILEKHGVAFQNLIAGTLEPKTEIEKNFILAIKGEKEPENQYEKTWIKYLNTISRAKKFHTLSGGRPQVDNLEDYVEPED